MGTVLTFKRRSDDHADVIALLRELGAAERELENDEVLQAWVSGLEQEVLLAIIVERLRATQSARVAALLSSDDVSSMSDWRQGSSALVTTTRRTPTSIPNREEW